MSNISSNSLFHFTSKLDYLFSILENGFYPRLCLETVSFGNENLRPGMASTIPMICFCDISLSQISNHIKNYGNYGLGMTKEWGIRNKLNPVIYLNANSKLSNSLSKLVDSIIASLDQNCTEDINEISDQFMNISKYIKQYDNCDRSDDLIKFYDEKEWRYVPEMKLELSSKYSIPVHEFQNKVAVEKINEQLIEYRLVFNVKDIKYIFLSNEEEIHTLISKLKNSKKFSIPEIEILTTKMMTTQQIREDF